MALTITDRLIRSPDTRRTAERPPSSTGWRVSWLPGRTLTQDQAEAAMSIAEEVSRTSADCDPEVYDDEFWSRIDALAAALGMSGSAAVAAVSEPPRSSMPEDQANDS